MAVTVIPNVTNWTVTPQNGQAGYFTLMNTWLGQSTTVIASLQTAIAAQNTANEEINALAIQTENNAIVANGLANFQGTWSNSIAYSKGQSVESTTGSKIYYISKVDSNLNHAVTDTNYWLYSPMNDKVNKTGNETISGVKTFSTSPIVPTPTTTGNVITMDNIIQKTAVGIGYGEGSGGLATQLTSKSTAITLSKPCGQIVTSNSALAAGTSVNFYCYNSVYNPYTDNILVSLIDPVTSYGAYSVEIGGSNSIGFFAIKITNKTGSTLSDAIIIRFSIIKGSVS